MTPEPLHESLSTMTRDTYLRELSEYLVVELNANPDSSQAQRAKYLLDRIGILATGSGVDPVIHRALAGIAAHLNDAEIRLSQLARGN